MPEISPRDYTYEIESLKDLISTIQSNVNFTITIVISVLAVSVAIAGIALFMLAQMWVNKRVDDEIHIIEDKMKSFSLKNPQILWARGKGVLISSENIGAERQHQYQIIGLTNFSKDEIIYIDAYYIQNGNKIYIDDYNVLIGNDGIKVNINHSIIASFNPNIDVHIFLMWSNPIFKTK